VDLPADSLAECLVNQLMTLQRAESLELAGHHECSKMTAIIGTDVYLLCVEALSNQSAYFSGIHVIVPGRVSGVIGDWEF